MWLELGTDDVVSPDTSVELEWVKDQSDHVVALIEGVVVETLLVEVFPPSTGFEVVSAVVDELVRLSDLVVVSEVLEALDVPDVLEMAEVETVVEEVLGP